MRPLSNCVARRGKIRCASSDGRIRAKFTFKAKTPLLYKVNMALRGLGTDETGSVPPSGIVSVTLNQGLATGTDSIGDVVACRALGRWRWDCFER